MYPSIRKISALLMTSAALLVGAGAQAQSADSSSGSWWAPSERGYVALTGGRSHFDQGRGDAYSLAVAGFWTPQMGLEVAATDFGRSSTADAYGFSVSGVGRLALNDTFTAFAKLGLQYSRSDASSVRDTGFGETMGVGVDISLTRQVAAVLQYDRAAVHFASGRDRVNLASVGLKYRY